MDNVKKNFESLYQQASTPNDLQLNQFPEMEGASISFNPSNTPDWSAGCVPMSGGRPDMIILEEAPVFNQQSLYQRIQELQAKPAYGSPGAMGMGGVEPPMLITAKDMAEEIDGLPRSFVEAALDPLDTGSVDGILEELRRQGDEVAVAIDRREEFESPTQQSLMNAMKAVSIPGPNGQNNIVYTSQSSMDAYSKMVSAQEKGLMFVDPSKKPALESYRTVIIDVSGKENDIAYLKNTDMVMAMGVAMMSIPKSDA